MWGLVLSLFAATENFGGAVVIRLFLGVFEAAVTPGFALFVSQVWPNTQPLNQSEDRR
jgi:ACS family allantoate permease-like MFS transporter